MEKMTIHRALSELKVIGARIQKGTEELLPSGITQKDKLVNNQHIKEDFEKKAKEGFQSVMDLIDRKNKIKSAIVKANAETSLTVAGKTMTIADAINLKGVIAYKRAVAERLKKVQASAKMHIEKNNEKVDANALELARVLLGKEGVKSGDDDVKKATESYLAANTFSLVDPIGVDDKVASLEKEIGDFETEVDAALSEINAVTFIEL